MACRTIEIEVPLEIDHYLSDLRFFMEAMVRKLHLNRHKGFAEGVDFYTLFGSLKSEVDELLKSLQSEGQFEAFFEGVDVANVAFLLSLAATRPDKSSYKKMQESFKHTTSLEDDAFFPLGFPAPDSIIVPIEQTPISDKDPGECPF